MDDISFDKTSLQQSFGKVLRHFRNNEGISQESLALECGLDRTYISLLERGLRMPTLYTIMIIANHLNIPVISIISETENDYNATN